MTTQQPKLILYFDVNGTLILKDTSKNTTAEQMLISALADCTSSKWDPTLTEPIPFRKYVDKYLLPGDKSDPNLKKKRQEIVHGFLKWLADRADPAYPQVLEDYHKSFWQNSVQVMARLSSRCFLVSTRFCGNLGK